MLTACCLSLHSRMTSLFQKTLKRTQTRHLWWLHKKHVKNVRQEGYQSRIVLNNTVTLMHSYVLSFWKPSAHGLEVINSTVMSPQVTVTEILFWEEQVHEAWEEHFHRLQVSVFFWFSQFLVLSDFGTLPRDLSKCEKLAASCFR